MTTPHITADHFLSSAYASSEYARLGSPEDLHTALEQFNIAEDMLKSLQDTDPNTLTNLQSLRSAAARGDYATAQTHYETI